tara:strand:+ start:916 stop:2022 length:1107 start_codon:yes stop_codon:yes gene_type:complete
MSKKTKLIFFHPYSSLGGADRSLARLINNLDINKFEVAFICLNNPYILNFLKRKINIIKLKSNRSIFSILEIRRYLNKFSNEKNVIFVSNQNFANVISTFIIKKFPNIKLVLIDRNHIDELEYSNNLLDSFKKIVIKFLMRLFYKNSDLIIGNAKILSRDLSLLVKKKVKTIYNPAKDKSIIALSNKKVKIINKKKLIINIGRLEIQKDHITLIKSIENLCDINLLIIGYGSLLVKLRKIIKTKKLKDRVKIITNISNPYPYLKKADLFVLSSLYEGFPNVLTEAIMLNIPVLSSNCRSGPKEILFNNKDQLFEPGNHLDLEKKIKKFFKNKRAFKLNSKKLYKNMSRFEPKKIAKDYESEFNKLLSK